MELIMYTFVCKDKLTGEKEHADIIAVNRESAIAQFETCNPHLNWYSTTEIGYVKKV